MGIHPPDKLAAVCTVITAPINIDMIETIGKEPKPILSISAIVWRRYTLPRSGLLNTRVRNKKYFPQW
jgi:hypothetical protein